MSDTIDNAGADIQAEAEAQYQALVDALERILSNPGNYADPAALQAALGGEGALEGISQDEFMRAVDEALTAEGVPQDVRDQVISKLEAQPDFDPYGNVEIVINEPDVNNYVDQSLDIYGEVHGDVYQANTSNVANATGEGAIAGEEVYGNQVQTGDGQQVGGDSGVQNQGDNSGQQAGGNATADNVTTGDGNTVGSGAASRIGAEQVSQDYASIDDSSQAFGEGAADNTSTDTYDSHDQVSYEERADGSFNYLDSDDDTNTQTQTIETGYGDDDYKGDDYKVDHDDYDVEDHGGDDYDQDAEIVEID
jgi:hypothetical protein